MTSIGAMKIIIPKQNVPENMPEKDKFDQYLVFVADSMGSLLYQGRKMDHYQKLFRIGDNLLMGTGNSGLILSAVSQLMQRKYSSAIELAQELSEFVVLSNYNKENYANFIIGGNTAYGLNIFHIDALSILEGPFQKGNKLYTHRNFCFDGSGRPFVDNYVQGLQDAGKISEITDVIDAFSITYEFSKKAARSIGVNDKLQFGIISNNGVSRLYHPDIIFDGYGLFLEYLNEIDEINLPVTNELSNDGKAERDSKARNLKMFLRDIYYALESDLSDFSEVQRNFTFLSEKYARDLIEIGELDKIKHLRKELRDNVGKGVFALANKTIDNLIKYQTDFNNRRDANKEEILSYK